MSSQLLSYSRNHSLQTHIPPMFVVHGRELCCVCPSCLFYVLLFTVTEYLILRPFFSLIPLTWTPTLVSLNILLLQIFFDQNFHWGPLVQSLFHNDAVIVVTCEEISLMLYISRVKLIDKTSVPLSKYSIKMILSTNFY